MVSIEQKEGTARLGMIGGEARFGKWAVHLEQLDATVGAIFERSGGFIDVGWSRDLRWPGYG